MAKKTRCSATARVTGGHGHCPPHRPRESHSIGFSRCGCDSQSLIQELSGFTYSLAEGFECGAVGDAPSQDTGSRPPILSGMESCWDCPLLGRGSASLDPSQVQGPRCPAGSGLPRVPRPLRKTAGLASRGTSLGTGVCVRGWLWRSALASLPLGGKSWGGVTAGRAHSGQQASWVEVRF